MLHLAVSRLAGLAACVALITFLLFPRALTIDIFEISEEARRSSGQRGKPMIVLKLNRSAYVRAVAFDSRHGRRLVPLDDTRRVFVRKTKEINVRFDRAPLRDDPRGPAEVLFIMVIVSPGTGPTEQDLMQSIPDVVAPQTDGGDEFARELKQIAHELESDFNCVADVIAVPAE